MNTRTKLFNSFILSCAAVLVVVEVYVGWREMYYHLASFPHDPFQWHLSWFLSVSFDNFLCAAGFCLLSIWAVLVQNKAFPRAGSAFFLYNALYPSIEYALSESKYQEKSVFEVFCNLYQSYDGSLRWDLLLEPLLLTVILIFAFLYPKKRKFFGGIFFITACVSCSILVCNITSIAFPFRRLSLFEISSPYFEHTVSPVFFSAFTLWAVAMGLHLLIGVQPFLTRKDTVSSSDFPFVITQLNLLKQQYDSGEITEEDYKQQRMECLKNSIK